MEDAHAVYLSMDDDYTALFGVFDGHAGREVSAYCARHIVSVVTQCTAGCVLCSRQGRCPNARQQKAGLPLFPLCLGPVPCPSTVSPALHRALALPLPSCSVRWLCRAPPLLLASWMTP
jgi:hypothetical protein